MSQLPALNLPAQNLAREAARLTLTKRAEEELEAVPDLEIRESLQAAVRYAVTRER